LFAREQKQDADLALLNASRRKIVTKFLVTAATLALAFAAPAVARDNIRTFTHEGVTYSYTSTRTDDTLVLEGFARPVGGRFRLVVRDGRVTGHVGGARVSFLVRDAVELGKTLNIASR
jgi:hypothetical protein